MIERRWDSAIAAVLVALPLALCSAADDKTQGALKDGAQEGISRVSGGDFAPQGVGQAVAAQEAPAPGQARKVADAPKPKRPMDSKPFLPDYMTQAMPDMLRPLDDSMTQEVGAALEEHFKKFYPDITYEIDWEDSTVNAYAWNASDGKHVALLGGLLRHKALRKEGVGLVLAHETGHHYGGAPTYPGGLSCEGQSDYWGAKVAMKKVWGDAYRQETLAAIEQVHNFFSKGLKNKASSIEMERIFSRAGGCSHPAADCRKKTYEAGLNDEPKPACAGPTATGTAMLPMEAPATTPL